MRVFIRLAALCCIAAIPLAAIAREQSLLEYGEQCAREIGEIPPFDCNDGTDIPITVDGKPPAQGDAPKLCDKPSLLHPTADAAGQCLPYSKILNLSRGNTQISAYCRRNALRADKDPLYDEVVVVAHHSGNGKTCWFQSRARANGIDASRVPPPSEKTPPSGHPSAVEFWTTPARIAAAKPTCIACHDAGPFIFSPYIGQVWDKIPTDPLGRYSNIGAAFSAYRPTTITTPGNACIGCHRIGSDQSCRVYIGLSAGRLSAPGNDAHANRYPLSHWMPTDNTMSEAQWNEANVRSVDALLACCKDKTHRSPNCTFTPVPASSNTR
ncbi:hypothetical protein SAMN05421548_13544 [Paraburkholderia lycopersici]|uniref:Uncharacterized protein n=2 Tax=Paraburkholderia lycopersici TaxID=416944 RepID=A0A1G7ARI7_9BURK|nr:hypothetical protein SAMN05421548_13544 [Paraburkholderia lycopersici]